ncbi:hypothetical protein HNQ77_003285 [Silvibacterium bohemicum]|uniref:Uncharacterized protein n=1 Tax=Silvibacterium bohemicum TaxID=1577686 RepID=A0A841JY36_9BACT|nr:hypothetical protein [Silvibacterium bohemicum]
MPLRFGISVALSTDVRAIKSTDQRAQMSDTQMPFPPRSSAAPVKRSGPAKIVSISSKKMSARPLGAMKLVPTKPSAGNRIETGRSQPGSSQS